jgi:4-amino-4-deoxy-L-arabinose transferase-like glycosyltransferase
VVRTVISQKRPQVQLTWPLRAATAIVVATLIRLPTLAFPLTEAHAFRQTQTAFSALLFARDGIDLLHPQVPVFGPPWSLPFEFPIYQAAAAILINLGVSAEVALRGLSLAAFAGTAGLLWLILHRHSTDRAAFIALVAFLFSPFALLWSRTSMVEYPATFGAMLFMLGTLEWQAGRGRRWFAIALFGGVGAALVKVTTAAFWLAPALFVRRRLALVLVAVPALAAIAWTGHADAVKAANANTAWLTSGALFNWNFGGDRFSFDTWAAILAPLLTDLGLLLLPIAILVVYRRERLLWAWFAIALIGPLLSFTNLYAVHTYYAAAVSPAIAALIGGGFDHLSARLPRRGALIAVGALGIAAVAFVATFPIWSLAYSGHNGDGILRAAAIIRAASPDGELVALPCQDWSPAAMYYADRRGTVLAKDSIPGYVVISDPAVCVQ